MPTKNINAEKIQGNLDVSSLSATTFNVNGQYDLPTNSTSNGDFFMYSGGSSSWNFIETSSITGTTGGTIPFVNPIGTDFEYKGGFNYDLNKLNITSAPNKGVVIDKEGGITISGNTSGVITLSGNNDTLSAATISSNNDLLINSTGTTNSVFGQEKQLYLSSSNPYVGINTITPQAILHIKGDSNTTGEAFISNKGNSTGLYQIQVYNNHDTINSGSTTVTNVGVDIKFNNSNTNRYVLPTLSGKTDEVLIRTDWAVTRVGDTNFNLFWYDVKLGNQFWSTGSTNGVEYMYPSLPDVVTLRYSSTLKNTFFYDSSPSGDNFSSHDNWLNSYKSVYGSGTATYKKVMSNVMTHGYTQRLATGGTNRDYTGSINNILFIGETHYINNQATSIFYNYNEPEFTANTNSRNVAMLACTSGIVDGSQNLFYKMRSGGRALGVSNTALIGSYIAERERKYQKPFVNSSSEVLGIKNIIGFGGGNNDANGTLSFDNTITFGHGEHVNLLGTATFYKNTLSGGNYYDRQFPAQTEGIWFGNKLTYKDFTLGMFKDPLLSGSTESPLNFGFGSRNIFFGIDGTSTQPTTGINRPGAGAGIFYLYADYVNRTGARTTSVPTSGITNAVGLTANERYAEESVLGNPFRNTGLYIHTDANRGHWIGDAFYVNPKRELFIRDNTIAINLSGSSATLDVIGSGTTSGTTSVRIKNSGDTVGLEVLDDGQVSFNGIPAGSGGLTAGWLYKNGSGQLSIVPGSSVAGNYNPSLSSEHLEVMLLSQTQVYSDLGTTVISDGGLVQQINDLSGKNNNATQTTSGDRFNWNVSASTLNNYSYLSNLDNSRFMNLTNNISLSASSTNDKGFCINVVIRINSADTFRLLESSTSNDFFGEFNYDGVNNHCDFTHSGDTTSLIATGSISYTLGDWMVLSFYNSDGSTAMTTYINGASNGSGTFPSPTIFRNLDRILVGGNMDIGEFTIYNQPSNASGGNFVKMVSEISRLMTKYNIT